MAVSTDYFNTPKVLDGGMGQDLFGRSVVGPIERVAEIRRRELIGFGFDVGLLCAFKH